MYQRLVAAGILPGGRADSHCEEQEEANSIKPVDFSQPETLKIGTYEIQATFGVEFPAEQVSEGQW
ncbi:hypothetical protein B7P43_G07039 [Cryptotermes secundus]|uniref:Uncharacterized protein n=1 Tax=Cryptotermes secundus TaxID=105785 RepID=A0A2J7RDN7_9NEOP|nr:hypothetical protein B7P43_G07039 [Cryptotermes secundus]